MVVICEFCGDDALRLMGRTIPIAKVRSYSIYRRIGETGDPRKSRKGTYQDVNKRQVQYVVGIMQPDRRDPEKYVLRRSFCPPSVFLPRPDNLNRCIMRSRRHAT
jgi:hypothetical protein